MSTMKRKSILCVFFIVLLVSPAPILAETLEDMNETRSKRQAQVLLPLASYAGMTVAAPVFAALVTAYGIHAVTKYAIKKAKSNTRTKNNSDSHSCANNRDGAEKHVSPTSTLTGRTMQCVDHTTAADSGRGGNPCKQKQT